MFAGYGGVEGAGAVLTQDGQAHGGEGLGW